MPPNLHLDPAVLRAAAGAVAALLRRAAACPALDPVDLTRSPAFPVARRCSPSTTAIAAAVARTGQELGELVDGLDAVAAGVATAERDVVRTLGAVGR